MLYRYDLYGNTMNSEPSVTHTIHQPDNGTAHLWLLRASDLGNHTSQQNWLDRLPLEERRRVLRMKTPEDQLQMLATRIFIRSVISAYLEGNPGDWLFDVSSSGRPYLANAPQPLHFNISHSGDLLVCVVAGAQHIGVDVEDSTVTRDFLRLAKRFFSADEYRWVEQQPAAKQQTCFYTLWNLKESHLKAKGLGLSKGLDTYCFRQDNNGNYQLSTQPDASEHWQHCLLSEEPGYQIAISQCNANQPLSAMQIETYRMNSERIRSLWCLKTMIRP